MSASSTDVPELSDDLRRAVAETFGVRTPIVLGYIASDGFPRCSGGAAVQAESGSRLMVWVHDEEATVLSAIAVNPPVTLFVGDRSAMPGDRVSGMARAAGDGSILVELVQVDLGGPERYSPRRRPARAPAAPTPSASVLDVAGLSIFYGSIRAVNSIALQVMRGEIFGLLGPNGAGKTSTLSAIEGLLRPRSGTIVLDGIDVLRHPLEARACMGVQLQATSFQASLTLKEIVRLFGGLYGVAMSDADIAATLGAVGLEPEMGRQFKQLSGGQQQRLSLQIAVLHEPTLLLLDEPTAGLDPQARRQLWGRIEHIRQNGGSILLTTHSMEEAQAVCDRVAIMDHGEILTCGSPQELIDLHRNDPNVVAVARGGVTLDDVFVGLTGTAIRE